MGKSAKLMKRPSRADKKTGRVYKRPTAAATTTNTLTDTLTATLTASRANDTPTNRDTFTTATKSTLNRHSSNLKLSNNQLLVKKKVQLKEREIELNDGKILSGRVDYLDLFNGKSGKKYQKSSNKPSILL